MRSRRSFQAVVLPALSGKKPYLAILAQAPRRSWGAEFSQPVVRGDGRLAAKIRMTRPLFRVAGMAKSFLALSFCRAEIK
jgi:hypothetical protein